jgi:hypothetical protein
MMRSGLILSGFYSNSMDNMYVFTVAESCQINHSRSSWVSLRPSSPPPPPPPTKPGQNYAEKREFTVCIRTMVELYRWLNTRHQLSFHHRQTTGEDVMAPAHIIIVFLVVILTSLHSVSTLPAAFTLIGKVNKNN